MRRSALLSFALSTLLALTPACAGAGPKYQEIDWEDLIPASWNPRQIYKNSNLAQLSDSDPRAKARLDAFLKEWAKAPANDAIDGKRIKLPGYVVPLEWGANESLKEFLLVPYFGACIHMPPPPPNQVVHAVSNSPLKGMQTMNSIWLYGTIRVEKSDNDYFGSSGYTLNVDKVEKYEQ